MKEELEKKLKENSSKEETKKISRISRESVCIRKGLIYRSNCEDNDFVMRDYMINSTLYGGVIF